MTYCEEFGRNRRKIGRRGDAESMRNRLLASMLSPVGAVIQLVMTVWDFFQAVREQLSNIFEVVESVFQSLDDIVNGVLDSAKQKVKTTLDNLLPVAIGVVARFLGLGDIPKRIREFVDSLRERIDNAIDALIERIRGLFTGDDAAQEETDEELPAQLSERRAFEVGDEQHHLWIERHAGRLTPMVASNQRPVEDEQSAAPDSRDQEAQAVRSVLTQLDQKLESLETEYDSTDLDQVDEREQALVGELKKLMAPTDFEDYTVEERVTLFLNASRFAPQRFDEAIFTPLEQTDDDEAAYDVTSPEPFKRSDYRSFHAGQLQLAEEEEETVNKLWRDEDREHLLENRLKDSVWGAGVKQPSGPRYAFIQHDTNVTVVAFVGEKSASPELKQAVPGTEEFPGFLRSLVEDSEANGLTLKRYVELLSDGHPRRGKNRELIAKRIRALDPGKHEWIPVSIAGEVAAYAGGLNQDSDEKVKRLEWIEAQLCLRTPTDLLLVRDFSYTTEMKDILEEDKQFHETIATTEGFEVSHDEDGEEARLSGVGAHPGSVLTEIASVHTMIEPFHEFLRQTFRDIRHNEQGPQEFLNQVIDNLPSLLWDGKDIKSEHLNIQVGELSMEDADTLGDAASSVGADIAVESGVIKIKKIDITVESGVIKIKELKNIARLVFASAEDSLKGMRDQECWK